MTIFPPCFPSTSNVTYMSTVIRIHDYGSRNTGNDIFIFVPLPGSHFLFFRSFVHSFILFIAIFHFKLPVLSTGNKIIALELELEGKKIVPMITRSERFERGIDSEKCRLFFYPPDNENMKMETKINCLFYRCSLTKVCRFAVQKR